MSLIADFLYSFGIPFNFTTLPSLIGEFALPLILLTIAFKLFMDRYMIMFEGFVSWILGFIISFSTTVFFPGNSIIVSSGALFFIGYTRGSGVKSFLLGFALGALYFFGAPLLLSYIPPIQILI